MATVVLVHGTFATGPMVGQQWWQSGSAFHQAITTLVHGANDEILWDPFLWDGKNSESSRYRAALDLYAHIEKIEESGEPYCLLGHSHGGSVISEMLLLASAKKAELPNMKTWITVASPFIKPRLLPFIFSRVDLVGKLLFMVLLFYVSVYALAGLAPVFYEVGGSDGPGVDETLLVQLVPVAVVFVYLWTRQSSRIRYHRWENGQQAAYFYATRWRSLWNADDEAIAALRATDRIRFRPFANNFAIPIVTEIAIWLAPLLLVYLCYSLDVLEYILLNWIPFEGFQYNNWMNNGYQVMQILEMGLSGVIGTSVERLTTSSDVEVYLISDGAALVSQILAPLAVFALLVSIATALLFLLRIAAMAVSGLTARMLNLVTTQRIRTLALGSDALGQVAAPAKEWPSWIPWSWSPLPSEISEQVTHVAEQEMVGLLARVRKAYAERTFAEGTGDVKEELERYFCSDGLVHTSYFKEPNFIKLIAHLLSTSDGFRELPALRIDRSVLGIWMDGIVKIRRDPERLNVGRQ